MFATLPASQRVLVRYFMTLACVILCAAFLFSLNLPLYGQTAGALLCELSKLTAGVLVKAPLWIAQNFVLFGVGVAGLWAWHLAKRALVPGGPRFAKADWLGLGYLLGAAWAYYAHFETVLPVGASAVQVFSVFATVSVLSWPVMLGVIEASYEDDSSTLGLLAALAGVGAVTATNCSVDSVAKDVTGPWLGWAYASLHFCSLVGALVTAYCYRKAVRSGMSKVPPATTVAAEQRRESNEAPISTLAAAKPATPLFLEENWEQRFARQRAQREAELKRDLCEGAG